MRVVYKCAQHSSGSGSGSGNVSSWDKAAIHIDASNKVDWDKVVNNTTNNGLSVASTPPALSPSSVAVMAVYT